MLGDGSRIFGRRQEPVFGGRGVGERFLRGEGFGGDDEERGLGLDDLEFLGNVSAVDIGDEMDFKARLGIGFEGFGRHDRAEVGPADANVDDIGDGLAGIPFPLPGADGLGEFAHVGEDGVDARHDVLAIDEDGPVGAVSQGDMKDGTIFGDIDFFAAEHPIAPIFDFGEPGKVEQQAQGFIGDAIFGEIQQNVVEAEGEFLEPLGILREEVAHMRRGDFLVMGRQGFPLVGLGKGAHDNSL